MQSWCTFVLSLSNYMREYMPLNAKQKAEFIKDAPATEPPLRNDPKELSATMQLCLRELGRSFAFKMYETCGKAKMACEKWQELD